MNGTRPAPNWIARYFMDLPDIGRLSRAKRKMCYGLAGAFASFAILGIHTSPSHILLGILLLAASTAFTITGTIERHDYNSDYSKVASRPSDQEIDQIFGTDALNIMNRALPQLGLTHEDLISPRGVVGPNSTTFDDLANIINAQRSNHPGASQMVIWGPGLPCHATFGNDGRLRYSKYQFMVICPTNYHLAIYRCELDLYTGGLLSEVTHEFHYADVVAIRTHTLPMDRRMGIQIHPRPSQAQTIIRFDTLRNMEIVVSSGDRASISMGVSSASDAALDRVNNNDSLEFRDVLQRVRQTLRDMKGGTHRSREEDLL